MQRAARVAVVALRRLGHRVDEAGAATAWALNSSGHRTAGPAGVNGTWPCLASAGCSRLWSSSSPVCNVEQDLGTAANPVPEELSESRFANSITHKLVEAGDRGDLGAVLEVVEQAGEEFDETAVEAALLQVERCTQGMTPDELQSKIHNKSTFQMLADMAVSSAGKSAPEVLARTIGVLGRLHFDDEMVIDELARSLMPGVQRLQPDQMQQLVEGLSSVDHSPGVLLLDAINERLQGLAGEVQAQQADSIREGLRDLGHTEGHTASRAA